jgi:hypothetical protein
LAGSKAIACITCSSARPIAKPTKAREGLFKSPLSLREAGNWERSRINKLQSSDFLEVVTRFLAFSSSYERRYHPLPVIPAFPVITGNGWLHGPGYQRTVSPFCALPNGAAPPRRQNDRGRGFFKLFASKIGCSAGISVRICPMSTSTNWSSVKSSAAPKLSRSGSQGHNGALRNSAARCPSRYHLRTHHAQKSAACSGRQAWLSSNLGIAP